MAGLRFPDLQSRPTEFLDFTSLTLDEFQQLVLPFEAAFHARMTVGRLDGKPRPARRFTVYKNCPLRTPDRSSPVIWTQFSFYLPIHQSLPAILGGRCCCRHGPRDGRGPCQAWRSRVCGASGRGRRVTLAVSSQGEGSPHRRWRAAQASGTVTPCGSSCVGPHAAAKRCGSARLSFNVSRPTTTGPRGRLSWRTKSGRPASTPVCSVPTSGSTCARSLERA